MAVLLIKALALGLVLILIGCEKEPPQKAAPTVVRKKIATSKPSAGTQKANAVNRDAPKPAQATSKKAASAAPAKQDQPPKPQVMAAAGSEAPKSSQAATTAKGAAAPLPVLSSAKGQVQASSQPAQSRAQKQAPAPKAGSSANSAQGEQPLQMASATGRPPAIVIDPFEPLFKEEAPTQKRAVAAKPDRPRRIPQTPLEKIDLGQLKLTAVIRTPAGNKALVEESSGKGYIIKKGTWIGVHAGRVQEITDDAVVVEEEIENALGEISLTKRELKLQKPPGE